MRMLRSFVIVSKVFEYWLLNIAIIDWESLGGSKAIWRGQGAPERSGEARGALERSGEARGAPQAWTQLPTPKILFQKRKKTKKNATSLVKHSMFGDLFCLVCILCVCMRVCFCVSACLLCEYRFKEISKGILWRFNWIFKDF